jgi:repressor LexA
MTQSPQLTVRQEEILKFYTDRQQQTGILPTLQEVADHFDFKSRNAVREHLRLLELKGAIRRAHGRARAVEILWREGPSEPGAVVRVPLLGTIPAGNLSAAFEDAEEVLNLPTGLFRGHRPFALHVRGTSMEEAGILNGDIAVLDESLEAEQGAIAAVLIDDEATLKRVYHTPEAMVLRAESSGFPDIEIGANAAQEPRVLGVLVGILRRV